MTSDCPLGHMRGYIRACLARQGGNRANLDDETDHCLAMAWFLWTQRPDHSPQYLGWIAVRRFWEGRDMLCMGQSSERWHARRMAGNRYRLAWLNAREPGPARMAELREQVQRIRHAAWTEFEQRVVEGLEEGRTQRDMAERFGCHVMRVKRAVWRIRQRLAS